MHRVGLLSTAYLPPVSYFTVMAKYGAVSIEARENFQKQSYRTRARIASSSGAEFISIPILKGEGHKRPISEIEIDYKRDWVLSHKRALMSCYGSSPFYIYATWDDLLHSTETHHLPADKQASEKCANPPCARPDISALVPRYRRPCPGVPPSVSGRTCARARRHREAKVPGKCPGARVSAKGNELFP